MIELEVSSVTGAPAALALRYERGGNHGFVSAVSDSAHWRKIECPAWLSGLTVEPHVADHVAGVSATYAETGQPNELVGSEEFTCSGSDVTSFAFYIDDWTFQNGVAKRADFSIVPLNNLDFRVHSVRLWPSFYRDKSSETQMVYSGQPRNAAVVDFDGDALRDLVITRHGDDRAIGWIGLRSSDAGAPVMEPATNNMFAGAPPLAGTEGLITADFDNDGHEDFIATHRSATPCLYRNINGSHYEDWTTSSGLLSALSGRTYTSNIYAASWVDYDADGFVDLTLIGGTGEFGGEILYLVHNDGGTFDSVELVVGPVGSTPLWADFDQDGDLDLVVLKSYPHIDPFWQDYMFVNQGDGTFVDDGDARLGTVTGYEFGTIAGTADVDQDGDLDIYFASTGELGWLENDPAGGAGPGYFANRSVHFSLNAAPTDLAVFDYDLDGYPDLLLGDGDPWGPYPVTTPHLFANRAGSGGARGLVDESTAAGLTGAAKFAGLAVADYNGDGFTDLYLTRAETQPFFYKARPAVGYGQNNWVGVKLRSPYGANNTTALGAMVTVTAGTASMVQVVDGGSGLASQRDRAPTFGLGSYSGTVTVQIQWPTGRVQTLSGVAINQYLNVVDDSPVVDEPTVVFSRVFHLDTGLSDWVFTWETFNDSPTTADEVQLDLSGVPARCQPAHAVLNHQTSGVTVSKTALGGGKYEHELVYAGLACEARCDLPYRVQSAVSDYTSTSDSRLIKITHCLASQ
jgi:hypothetical protein